MIGHKPSIYWQATWRLVSPLIVLVILVFYLVTQAQQELTYLVWDPNSVSSLFSTDCRKITSQTITPNSLTDLFDVLQEGFPSLATVLYPPWVNGVIFILAGIPSLIIPVYALCKLVFDRCRKKQTLTEDKMSQLT